MISDSWPSMEESERIYQKLLDLDLTASADLALAYCSLLTRYLLQKCPRVDPDLCHGAADEALMNLIKRPEKFNPSLKELGSYLRMSADGDLKNALDRQQKHSQKRSGFDVELLPDPRNSEEEPLYSWDDPALQSTLAELDSRDREVIELMRSGERSTAIFAALLDCDHLPEEEQRRLVKQNKDRIQKRLQRKVRCDG